MYINGHKCEKCLTQKDDFYGCRHEHDIIVIPEILQLRENDRIKEALSAGLRKAISNEWGLAYIRRSTNKS